MESLRIVLREGRRGEKERKGKGVRAGHELCSDTHLDCPRLLGGKQASEQQSGWASDQLSEQRSTTTEQVSH